MGDQRVRARLRRLPAARRTTGRHPRAAWCVHGRARDLLGRLASLRARLERGIADRRPRAAGARRRHDHPLGALDPHDDVHRGPRAQHRAGRLGRGRRLRRRGRRPDGRHPDRPPVLGMDLLRQRPGRHRRARALPDPARREPRRARAEPRHPGRRARHVRPQPARARHHAGQGVGVGLREDDRRLRRLCGAARRLRALGAAPGRAARAVLDLPAPDPDRREHRRFHHGNGDVLDVPDAHALHAAGARDVGAQDGIRLPRGRRDGGHLGERRRAGREPDRRQARADPRHGAC